MKWSPDSNANANLSLGIKVTSGNRRADKYIITRSELASLAHSLSLYLNTSIFHFAYIVRSVDADICTLMLSQ